MSGPLPPADIDARQPLVQSVAAGTLLHRFHNAAYGPIFYDRADAGRLNAPHGSYGVLYAAQSVEGLSPRCFSERPARPA